MTSLRQTQGKMTILSWNLSIPQGIEKYITWFLTPSFTEKVLHTLWISQNIGIVLMLKARSTAITVEHHKWHHISEIWDECPTMAWSQCHLCLLSVPLFYCIPLLSSWQCLSSEYAGSVSLERCSGSNGVNRSVRKIVPFSISLSLPVALQSFVCVWWEKCGTTKTGRLHFYEGRGCGSNSSSCHVLRKG